MNAITLLSGWAGAGSAAAGGAGSHSSNSRKRSRAGSIRNGVTAVRDDAAARAASLKDREGFDASSNVTSTSGSVKEPPAAGNTAMLKPPEARLYEEIEAQHVLGSSAAAGEEPDLSTSYPTPPPTPPMPLGNGSYPDEHTPLLSQQEESTALLLAEKPEAPAASPLEQQQQRDRHARQLARSYPIRCLTRLYVLLRRFLALFGIQLDPCHATSPSSISASSVPPYSIQQQQTGQPLLSSPIAVQAASSSSSESAPPSYADATRPPANYAGNSPVTQTQTSASPKRSRWRIPGFRGRRPPPVPLAPVEEDGGSSSDSSTLASQLIQQSDSPIPSKRRKKASTSTLPSSIPPSPSIPGSSPSLSSSKPSNSVAQIALSKPKLLVLDLDETLIHSTSRVTPMGGFNPVTSADGSSRYNANTSGLKVRVVEVVLDGRSVIYHVYKRPWVDFFLKKVSPLAQQGTHVGQS